MQAAPIPRNDAARLEALYSYEALDSATEQELDDLVQAAARLCGTTFGAISLIDRDRQWFKAQSGFSLKETLRSDSVCGHGILSRSFFEVPDTQADPRFEDNPLLNSLGVRFYGGTQLIGAEGHVLGMLCVLDPEPMQLSEAQKTQLSTLAMQAMALLEAHRARRRLQALGSLWDQAADEIYVFDLATDLLLDANEAARRQLPCRSCEVRLQDFSADLPGAELEAFIRQARDGAAEVSFQTEVTRAWGRMPIAARFQRLQLRGRPVLQCTIKDPRTQDPPGLSDFSGAARRAPSTPAAGPPRARKAPPRR